MDFKAHLVEFTDIQNSLGSEELHLFDTRWYLDGRNAQDTFQQSHIRSAKFIDVDLFLSDSRSKEPRLGRHPLPTPKTFETVMSSLGVTKDHLIVFYDDQGGSIAARGWWMAITSGYNAALLNGGFDIVPELFIETGDSGLVSIPSPDGDSSQSSWDPRFVIWEEELKEKISSKTITLLDARAKDRFLGINETVDPRAGHIPSAISAFWKENIDESNKFKSKSEIRDNFARLGVDLKADKEVVSSCGSGITACHNIFSLLYSTGMLARLYPPSFSGWCHTATNEVETNVS